MWGSGAPGLRGHLWKNTVFYSEDAPLVLSDPIKECRESLRVHVLFFMMTVKMPCFLSGLIDVG